ncbi:HAMP domain-containing histidine kinase [Agrobacterium vitis]|uniref:histidine kinase n=1 Tax=Agrobacterium vitis TaxID=373 RepID=A0AAE4WA38_AGRVI|nr:HAMP domain-containing sensor histidine kinase [Agrobacterium vitis]MCF1498542.1 HAMP domain-containing histidine kinase [Allorhizobium sp. Av2]MCM2438340.1 HAMP domain-containing histidine kinase [Agrobacterium vitis]MUZ56278.1 HAMP domain-containing protein [Agrobacterium vitis]MVA64585.1 HAMP domain-containing protein [Agrobacterium vitis]MVA85556.1 HAMP domain-containing protein [Agrobacterium vitis]
MTFRQAFSRLKYRRISWIDLRWFSRWLRRQFPTGLFARALLIIILPMLILQTVLLFVFMERHWQMVTQRLSAAVTRDIATVIVLLETYPQDAANTLKIANSKLGLVASLEKNGELPAPRPKPFFSILDQLLSDELRNQIKRPFWIDTVGDSPLIEIRIQLNGEVLRIFARRNQAYASNTHIFLLWMFGTSLVLIVIATLFLRGQIRPILSLAEAAESFGKGQKPAKDFSPRGADEIRRAGLAFILMRERIERQMEQRTAMLTGVSHDLRTILTRFKLQLALAGDNPDLEPLNEDVEAMQTMLEGYMAFAKGEAEENFGPFSLKDMMEKISADYRLHGKAFSYVIEGDEQIRVRPNAFWRLVGNLAANGRRYANTMDVEARHGAKWLTIVFDDDGPGIPAQSRDDVFKPFFRLDEARNQDASGTGLGLAIARDIARSHGGNVTLGDSPLGGLRATIRIPV